MIFGYSQAQVDGLLAAKDAVIALQDKEIARLSTANAGLHTSVDKLAAELAARGVAPEQADGGLPESVRRALTRHTAGRGIREIRAAYAKAGRSMAELQARGLGPSEVETTLVNDILRGDTALVDQTGTAWL